MNREEYKKQAIHDYMMRWNDSEERATEQSERDIKNMENDSKLMDQFEDQRGSANQASSQKNIDKETLALHTKNCIEIMQEIQNEITTWMEEYDSCQ